MIELFGAMPSYMLFFIAAALALVTRGSVRTIIMLTVPVVSGWLLWQTGQSGTDLLNTVQFMGYELTPFRTDKLSLLFGYLFHIAAFIAILFALHIRDTAQHVSGLIYAGSALGAMFAGDLITLFVFLEIMAVSSAFLIWTRGTESALASGMRYLIIQVISGLLLLAGAIMTAHETGSLAFNEIGLDTTAGILIFLAIGIKAAFPLVHNWVTDSYPEATPTGAVFLCIFTTKTAVYLLARGFPGEDILIYIGVAMAVFPIFYAAIENDLRRLLAYSLINQVGFMIVGVGVGTALAINGTAATAFSHVIYKSLLFMVLGAVIVATGKSRISDLGGLYKSMPKTTIFGVLGMLSISAPLFCGFVSKSMILSALLKEDGMGWVWLALLFAGAGVFVVSGLKIVYFTFFGRDSGLRPAEPPRNMLAAMGLAAALCIGVGVYPAALYALLPFDVPYTAYDTTHVLTQLQLLFFTTLGFVWLIRRGWYPLDRPSVNIDVEWIYRKLLPCSVRCGLATLKPRYNAIVEFFRAIVEKGIIKNLAHHHGPEGILARAWPIGSMVLWVALLLGFYLILYYLM